MYSFRKSKKGFTLIELMVVVAIIGVLALLGLRMYTGQQNKAKNAIVKANTATIHTIIQGNLADSVYATALLAVNSVANAAGADLAGGKGTNLERPAGMKNPHLTADTDVVVQSTATTYADAAAFLTAINAAAAANKALLAGAVIVALDTNKANKFYVIGLDNNASGLGEVYVATK